MKLPSILLLADSAFPSGAFGHSFGLETAVDAGRACDEAMRQFPGVARFAYQAGRSAEAGQDYARARTLYDTAADEGSAAAMVSLGVLYESDRGGAPDFARARDLYGRAAALGDREAALRLGSLYETGRGVDKDYAQARRWYEKSAALGEQTAMEKLAIFYQRGLGGPKIDLPHPIPAQFVGDPRRVGAIRNGVAKTPERSPRQDGREELQLRAGLNLEERGGTGPIRVGIGSGVTGTSSGRSKSNPVCSITSSTVWPGCTLSSRKRRWVLSKANTQRLVTSPIGPPGR